MTDTAAPPRDNLRAAGFLIADMALNIWALTIVKAMGADYPAVQLVFLRAVVGLAVIAPWVWRERAAFAATGDLRLHALRVGLSTVTLATSFYAIARVPFALFTAVNFTRPILLMLMAALFLREVISGRQWIAAGVGLAGALVAVGRVDTAAGWGLIALVSTVLTGTAAVIVTRRLSGCPPVVLMAFYTGGLALASTPFALTGWQAVPPADLPVLLAVGLFAQAGQLFFLRAHRLGDAGVLGPVGYSSLILSASVGWAVFGEVPTLNLILGATLIVAATLTLARRA
jgi:drug/metabolite transporter (DMT)-like permease